jgi:hypothetical protein
MKRPARGIVDGVVAADDDVRAVYLRERRRADSRSCSTPISVPIAPFWSRSLADRVTASPARRRSRKKIGQRLDVGLDRFDAPLHHRTSKYFIAVCRRWS